MSPPARKAPFWLLGASAALLACHPSADSKPGPTTTASSPPAAAVPPPERPAPALEADAGPLQEPTTRVVCGRRAPPQCRFQGRIRTIRPAILAPTDTPIDERDTLERAAEITLDDVSPLECATLQLRGVRQASGEPGSPGHHEGPSLWLEGEMPVARSILITLRPGLQLPFAEGDLLCGSVTVYRAGFGGRAHEALLTRPNGDVLLATATSLPRDPSPLPGWTITFSQQKSPRAQWRDYAMIVTHLGVAIQTSFKGPPAPLHAPDGDYLVESNGYTRMGPLSDEEATSAGYLATKGYSFTLVRAQPASRPTR